MKIRMNLQSRTSKGREFVFISCLNFRILGLL